MEKNGDQRAITVLESKLHKADLIIPQEIAYLLSCFIGIDGLLSIPLGHRAFVSRRFPMYRIFREIPLQS